MTAGYKFDLQNEIYLIPNILTRVTAGAPIANLISLNLDYQNKLLASVNFQPASSFGGFIGYRLKNNFSFSSNLKFLFISISEKFIKFSFFIIFFSKISSIIFFSCSLSILQLKESQKLFLEIKPF